MNFQIKKMHNIIYSPFNHYEGSRSNSLINHAMLITLSHKAFSLTGFKPLMLPVCVGIDFQQFTSFSDSQPLAATGEKVLMFSVLTEGIVLVNWLALFLGFSNNI